MPDHVERFVGILFQTLSEQGHTEATRALRRIYESRATAERSELTEEVLSEFVTVLDETVDAGAEADVLATAIDRLLTRFSTVVEATPVAIVVVDENGRVRLWNDGARRLFGWREAEVRERAYPEFLTASVSATAPSIDRLRSDGAVHGVETCHVHRDGRVMNVRVWGAPIEYGTRPGGGVFVVSDITEQRQREQRLAVLDRALRHNIRNDVTVVRGHLEMLVDDPDENEHLRRIEERLTDITDLSAAARSVRRLEADGDDELSTVDLVRVVEERVDRLRAERPHAEVVVDTPASCPVAAHDLLPYAVENVLENAVEHNDRDQPHVQVRVTTERDGPQRYAQVQIVDDGPGLPPTEREVLTARTETPLAHSDGVGLWLTHWIVRSSNGVVSVESADDGTRVCLRLSVAE